MPDFAPRALVLPDGDVAVEATIRLERLETTGGPFEAFGLSFAVNEAGAYSFGICADCLGGSIVGLTIAGFEDTLADVEYSPGNGWHTYRLERRGAYVIGFVDGAQVFSVIETSYPSGGGVGLWASGAVVEVSDFRVVNLE